MANKGTVITTTPLSEKEKYQLYSAIWLAAVDGTTH